RAAPSYGVNTARRRTRWPSTCCSSTTGASGTGQRRANGPVDAGGGFGPRAVHAGVRWRTCSSSANDQLLSVAQRAGGNKQCSHFRGRIVTELDALVRRADPVNAAEPLDDPHRVPVDVVVDDEVAVLQVLALTDAVGAD